MLQTESHLTKKKDEIAVKENIDGTLSLNSLKNCKIESISCNSNWLK
jgi:hypothetical protein